MIGRVANTITAWGVKDHYFENDEEARTFSDELTYLLVNQKMAFNSPVWFNVGVEEKPQIARLSAISFLDLSLSLMKVMYWAVKMPPSAEAGTSATTAARTVFTK